jgi:hypothetical protein
MINKKLSLIFLIHFALGLGGFLAISGWALGSADAEISGSLTVSAGPSAVSGWFERIVHFGLLQPIAHWVLSAGVVRWWTWAGLIALIAVIAVNSGVVVALVGLGTRGYRSSGSAVRTKGARNETGAGPPDV